MTRVRFNKAFTIIELIAVIAIALVLGGILLGIGNQIRSQANVRLAESTIDVLVCALEQYFSVRNEFPREVIDSSGFESNTGVAVDRVLGLPASQDWSSTSLYYSLKQIPKSNSIVKTVYDGATTGNAGGIAIQLDLDNNGEMDFNYTRFIDPWGRSFIYTYVDGQCFPKLISAGPDGVFATGDDISSRR